MKIREFWITLDKEILSTHSSIGIVRSDHIFPAYINNPDYIHVREVSASLDQAYAECERALEQYIGIAGHDCDKSTTKWSAAEMALDSLRKARS